MKLLFDENLSPAFVELMREAYPSSIHVRQCGLERSDDRTIWDYAREHGLAIVTKDDDFRQLAVVEGPPPKGVWLAFGNCTTQQVAAALLRFVEELRIFDESSEQAFIMLSEFSQ